jgi:hypothetical protein
MEYPLAPAGTLACKFGYRRPDPATVVAQYAANACGVRSRAGPAAGGECQAAHGGLKTPSWAMMVAMSSAAHSSLILPSVTR